MLDCWAADAEDPDFVAAIVTIGLSDELGRPGMQTARTMQPVDFVRCLLVVEAQRGIARRDRAVRQAFAALRGARK